MARGSKVPNDEMPKKPKVPAGFKVVARGKRWDVVAAKSLGAKSFGARVTGAGEAGEVETSNGHYGVSHAGAGQFLTTSARFRAA
jgi:hypothetical protein